MTSSEKKYELAKVALMDVCCKGALYLVIEICMPCQITETLENN